MVSVKNPKIVVCAGISVEHEMCQEDPQYVRGIILTSGYVSLLLLSSILSFFYPPTPLPSSSLLSSLPLPQTLCDFPYVCNEISQDPPRTHVAYVVQFDPKGWIPALVVNLIASEQTLNVLRLKKYPFHASRERRGEREEREVRGRGRR